jgi:inhibitor of cysteine peptidase
MRLVSVAAALGLTVALATAGCSAETSEEDPTASTGEDETAEDELKSLTLTEADEGRTVTIAKGQNVVVKLQSNPSTGYRWQVVATDRTFGYPASTRFVKNGDAAGASGVERMTWKTSGPLPMTGTHQVKLEYRRPWEKDSSPAKTFTFSVSIVEAECPQLSPPAPGFCKQGRIQATKDANGCTTRYECIADCRANACGSGKSCQYCWTQFACIPNGALC